jgi:hypothetical protein
LSIRPHPIRSREVASDTRFEGPILFKKCHDCDTWIAADAVMRTIR